MAQFWKSFPLENILESKLNMNIFRSQIFDRDRPTLLRGYSYKILSGKSIVESQQVTKVREFIKMYFGSPPKTPILDIPEKYLLPIDDHIIIVTSNISNDIIGCIRYHYLGEFITVQSKQIYCVDCFCIHPNARKKGLGDFLLTTLHSFVNSHSIPYSLFLKEGYSLNIFHTPIYSSVYVYRKLFSGHQSINITPLSPQMAFLLIDIYRQVYPQLFIIYNFNNINQRWFLYRCGLKNILACFQDTFQWFLDEDGKKNNIIWITAWFESPGLTDDCREEASNQLSDYLAPEFQYVWMNKEWCSKKSSIWKDDGAFHWYTYQWCSSARISKSYCIMT